jgi:hypothetical protein
MGWMDGMHAWIEFQVSVCLSVCLNTFNNSIQQSDSSLLTHPSKKKKDLVLIYKTAKKKIKKKKEKLALNSFEHCKILEKPLGDRNRGGATFKSLFYFFYNKHPT